MGLYPRNAANSSPTGGRCARCDAVACDTPCAVSPDVIVAGSVEARPTTMSEKNKPIDSTCALFWNVARMPDAAPRSVGFTLFMMAVVFGAVNRPTPMPFRSSRTANTGKAKFAGSSMSSREAQRADDGTERCRRAARRSGPTANPTPAPPRGTRA